MEKPPFLINNTYFITELLYNAGLYDTREKLNGG